ncbi:hypothetical protein CEXT_407871 [Caerostris extrusa]|uniref:Uncharacterized protein n=1 Tax=Caerostris extrusa TaxID=172846 RepID=A0AAV4W555_CAEEX|nr:hypothetical protein CEXT_407871 [Caerostris extrusa]
MTGDKRFIALFIGERMKKKKKKFVRNLSIQFLRDSDLILRDAMIEGLPYIIQNLQQFNALSDEPEDRSFKPHPPPPPSFL